MCNLIVLVKTTLDVAINRSRSYACPVDYYLELLLLGRGVLPTRYRGAGVPTVGRGSSIASDSAYLRRRRYSTYQKRSTPSADNALLYAYLLN